MKTLLLLISIFCLGQKAMAQYWIQLLSDSPYSELYIRSAYESRNKLTGKTLIWTKRLLDETTVEKEGKEIIYRNATLLVLYIIDIPKRRLKIMSTITQDSKGKEVDRWYGIEEEEEWYEIFPETDGYYIMSNVQERFFKPGL